MKNKLKAFGRFLISWPFWLNVVLAILASYLIFHFLMKHLDSYTRQADSEQIEVGNYFGMDAADATKEIEKLGLRVEVDSVFIEGFESGTVVNQEPVSSDSSGFNVKKDRVISLKVQSKLPPGREVPNVIFRSRRLAETKLLTRGFGVDVKQIPHDDNFVLDLLYEGKSLKNKDGKVPPGIKLALRSKLTLVVGQGKPKSVNLPDVVGLTIIEANKRLSGASLLMLHAGCETCESVEDSLSSVVIRQSPTGGRNSVIAAGTEVTLWFGTSLPEDSEPE